MILTKAPNFIRFLVLCKSGYGGYFWIRMYMRNSTV